MYQGNGGVRVLKTRDMASASRVNVRDVKSSNYFGRKRPRPAVLVNSFDHQLYQMIIGQLHGDGYVAAASALSDSTGVLTPSVDKDTDRLRQLVARGLSCERQERNNIYDFHAKEVVESYISSSKVYMPVYYSSSWSVGRRLFKFRERFCSASLDGSVRDIMFSPDGTLVSCAGTNGMAIIFSLEALEDLSSIDGVRVLNGARGVESMPAARQVDSNHSPQNINDITELSVARRYNDHTQAVDFMRFHPRESVCMSGDREGNLYVRNFTLPDSKVLLKLHDKFPLRSGVFHPNGEYAMFVSDHFLPRLVNMLTGQVLTTSFNHSSVQSTFNTGRDAAWGGALACSAKRGQHSAGLTDVTFSPDGRVFVTSGLDGTWLLCDGVSGKAIHHAESAHSGVPVTSTRFSRTGQILLTCGMDSAARLWDLRRLSSSSSMSAIGVSVGSALGKQSSVAEVMAFGETAKCEFRSIRAAFSSDESHVVCQDSTLLAIHNYSVYSGDVSSSVTTQPAFAQRGLACSPFSSTFISGGDDNRLRIWTPAWLPF